MAAKSTIEIKHRFNGGVLFSHQCNTVKECLLYALQQKADLTEAYLGGVDLGGVDLGGAYLRGADLTEADLTEADLGVAYLRGACLRGADLGGAYLRGADLGGADLGGAYLIDGGEDARGWRFVGTIYDDQLYIHAGCRWLPYTKALEYWCAGYSGDSKHPEADCLARVKLIGELAKIRGWNLGE